MFSGLGARNFASRSSYRCSAQHDRFQGLPHEKAHPKISDGLRVCIQVELVKVLALQAEDRSIVQLASLHKVVKQQLGKVQRQCLQSSGVLKVEGPHYDI